MRTLRPVSAARLLPRGMVHVRETQRHNEIATLVYAVGGGSMHRRRPILPMVIVLSLLLAGALTGLAGATGTAQVTQLTIQLREQNGSGQNGTATLIDQGNGTTRVQIALQGFPGGNSEPAYIHQGTCGSLNSQPTYNLKPVVDGISDS